MADFPAGLERASQPWIFAVVCDMPFITSAVIEYLAQQRNNYQAVMPMVQGYPQPLAAFYAKECLGTVRECLNGNYTHSPRALLDNLQVRYVAEVELQTADPQLRSFLSG